MNKDKVEKTIGAHNERTFFVSCGPHILNNIVEQIWSDMGIKQEQMFRF
jgi:hypothetical protein